MCEMQKVTTVELKRANTHSVLEFVYRRQRTSKPEIVSEMHLSRPTVDQILKELIERELISFDGYVNSTGGRKADAIAFNANARLSVGVELLRDSYEIVAINLYGEILKAEKHPARFENHDRYILKVCQSVNAFIDALPEAKDRVLGVNIVLQGLISSDGASVTYGKILNCTGLSVKHFQRHINMPCLMAHDGESAAMLELWFSPDIVNAIFFHIRSNMSGALIIGGKFLKGNELKSGVFEHMTIVPDGRSCYCGKCGCMETYCSLSALLEPHETPDSFFDALRSGGEDETRRWDEYLKYLSTAIDNLHMMMDYDIILGGVLGRHLIPADIGKLHRLVAHNTAFPTERKFIHISESARMPIAAGAALPCVMHFLDL